MGIIVIRSYKRLGDQHTHAHTLLSRTTNNSTSKLAQNTHKQNSKSASKLESYG